MSQASKTQVKYEIHIASSWKTKSTQIDKNHQSIASGIVQVTAILAKGDIIDSCQKLNIIIGNAKVIADKVSINASFIAKKLGSQ
jgi:hypothetical protein